MRRLGTMVVLLSGIALVGAFIPGITLIALVVAVVSLALGILCLIIDPSFNALALLGTVVASAAVSLSIIMGIAYGS